MQHYILANVFRYNPDTDTAPAFREYRVPVEDKISVLRLLDRIYKEQDSSLSFRNYCCGLQMCRSCLMKINQKKKFACLTLVEPGETVVIEPATYPEDHIKDLVVHIREG
jgi:succinate dehydrogenase iron-sulfur subunit